MKTAFVIAGGGSLGAMQVGMLKALHARGVHADVVAGVSVGSINAFFYASDPTTSGIERLERVWLGIRRQDVFPAPGLRGLWRIMRGSDHFFDPAGLAGLLAATLPHRDFEATARPCYVVATDVLTGSAVTLQQGPVLPALMASAAIPAVFPPVRVGDRLLNDGSLAYFAPFEAVVGAGATRLYVLPTGYSCARRQAPTTALSYALSALNQLTAGKLIGSIRHFARDVDVQVVPPLCPMSVSPLDFRHTASLIRRAEEQTYDWLEHGTRMIDGLPHQMLPHFH